MAITKEVLDGLLKECKGSDDFLRSRWPYKVVKQGSYRKSNASGTDRAIRL